jgi:hypothetical protein
MKTDGNGLTIHAQHGGIAIAVHTDNPSPAERIVVPARALEEFEGREQTNVDLQYTTSSKVLARWSDHGVPCVVEYELTNSDTATDLPERLAISQRTTPVCSKPSMTPCTSFLPRRSDSPPTRCSSAAKRARSRIRMAVSCYGSRAFGFRGSKRCCSTHQGLRIHRVVR